MTLDEFEAAVKAIAGGEQYSAICEDYRRSGDGRTVRWFAYTESAGWAGARSSSFVSNDAGEVLDELRLLHAEGKVRDVA
jgi:hypothetical protein